MIDNVKVYGILYKQVPALREKTCDGCAALPYESTCEKLKYAYGACNGTIFVKQEKKTMLQVGDKVKIVGYKDKHDAPIYWTDSLELLIGTITTVTKVYESNNDVDLDGYGFIFPISSLRLLDREKEQEKIMFKIGDKVKVVRKITERTEDFQNGWTPDMDSFIGKVVTISDIGIYGIVMEENSLRRFPPASLELVSSIKEANPVPEVRKEEDKNFYSLNELFSYLGEGNVIQDYNYSWYKLQDNKLLVREVGVGFWNILNIWSILSHEKYTKIGKANLDWYEYDFKPCLCYVWDEDEDEGDRIALVVGYDKDEDYPFRTNPGFDAFHFAKPLTLDEVTKYCLECE